MLLQVPPGFEVVNWETFLFTVAVSQSSQCQLVARRRSETCCTRVSRLELIRDEFTGTSERQACSPSDVSPSEPPDPTESNELTTHVLRPLSSTNVSNI